MRRSPNYGLPHVWKQFGYKFSLQDSSPKYPPHTNSSQEWLNDDASDYSVARNVLTKYHPLQPEMWLHLADGRQFPQCIYGGTIVAIVAPWPDMPTVPDFVKKYEDCPWRGAKMPLLEYLRKANANGHINEWVRKRHASEGKTEEMDLETFARQVKGRGEKMVSADTVHRLNDKYFGQWLALHVPFRTLAELQDTEVREKVPKRYCYFACALRRRPAFWRDPEKVRADMMLEACGDDHIANVLHMIESQAHLVEEYLSGRLNKEDEAKETTDPKATAGATKEAKKVEWHPKQTQLMSNINSRVDQALRANRHDDPEEAEKARDLALEHGKILVGLGGPGTGKTTAAAESIRRARSLGARILIAVPTGQMSSRMRELFPDVEVDTCHGAFLLHRPEMESLPLMSQYDLVVVDEVSQLSKDHFERICRMWHAADKVPALVFLGDFYQLPGVDPLRATDSAAWKKVRRVKLVKSYRCSCPVLMKKIYGTRTSRPSKKMVKSICKGHKAWRGTDGPTREDLRELWERTKGKTTIVTCTRRAAAKVNVLMLSLLFPWENKLLTTIPGHFDANPENYDEKNKFRTDRRPIPTMVRIHEGMRIFLTNNLDKKSDFVNGMEATVQSYHAGRKCLVVLTRTQKRLSVWPYTDREHERVMYFPIRVGYAGTLHKFQGATMDHATIWLDVPGMKGAGHVALSRVRTDKDYEIGGDVEPAHFEPAM